MEEGNNKEIISGSSPALITEKIKTELKATKPWVRFLSILGFISVAFGVIGMAGMTVAMKVMPQNFEGPPMVFMIGMNLILILLYIFPALYLFRYASSIGTLLKKENIESLERAMTHQKSFWRFVGIMVIAALILGVTMAIVMPSFVKHMNPGSS